VWNEAVISLVVQCDSRFSGAVHEDATSEDPSDGARIWEGLTCIVMFVRLCHSVAYSERRFQI
jgi:hypothetical protein